MPREGAPSAELPDQVKLFSERWAAEAKFADAWRTGHPKLAAWFEEFAKNPGIAQTAPKE